MQNKNKKVKNIFTFLEFKRCLGSRMVEILNEYSIGELVPRYLKSSKFALYYIGDYRLYRYE